MQITQDIRFACRRLLARPAYTLLIVATLALAIGAATAVFSVVDQTILRPAPFLHADRLVDVMHIHRVTKGGGNQLSPQKIGGWQRQAALFERLEGAAPAQMDLTGAAQPERLRGFNVSLDLFSMLGVRPQIGRDFQHGDGARGSDPIVIISDAVWRRQFAARPEALGQTILLNEQRYTIVGVMPRRFRLQGEFDDFFLPVDLNARVNEVSLRNFYGIGRLAPGVAQEKAQSLADDIADRLQAEMPLKETWGLGVRRKRIASIDDTTRTALFVLLGAVGFVLLIACANVANLFLSRAPARQREMAIHSALGANRMKLFRSVMVESLLLALAGGSLGILLAGWWIDAVIAAAPAGLLSRITTTIELDGRVLGAALAMMVVSGILFGIVPALRGSRPNLEATLRGSGAASGASSGRLPGLLVAAEVAFAVILLVGATLMARTLINLHSIEPGFEPRGLVAMNVDLPSDRYPTMASQIDFFTAVGDRLRGTGGISDVTVAQGVPPSIGGITFGTPEVEGRAGDHGRMILPNGTVPPTYFQTLRIPLRAGRNFAANEPEDSVIVSEALAARFWPEGGAVGRRFRTGSKNPWLTVVGVVGNVQAHGGADARTTMQFYHPMVARPVDAAPAKPVPVVPQRRSYRYSVLIVRAGNPAAAVPHIKQQIWAIDKNQPVERIALVEDSYAEMFARQRFVLQLMSAFALVSLILTAAGIFGVLSQAVAQRTREIGIRVALGARPADVMKLVVSRGMLLTTIGVGAGIAGALVLVRTVRALLYGVTPTDPVSFAAVTALLLGVALLACWLPTRNAMRIEPSRALRVE